MHKHWKSFAGHKRSKISSKGQNNNQNGKFFQNVAKDVDVFILETGSIKLKANL